MLLLPPWDAEREVAAPKGSSSCSGTAAGSLLPRTAGKELGELPHTALLTHGHKHLQNGDIVQPDKFTTSTR